MAKQNVSTAILFDRDEVEHLGSLSQRPKRLNGSRLLWVDIDRRTQASADEVAEAFDLEETTRRRLASSEGRAVFVDEGRYIHVTTYSPCNEAGRETELTALECVVGKNWVITAHDRSLEVLEEFADRVSGSGDTGSLDGPAFLATLLEWVLGAYSEAFERLEERLEEFDVDAMRGQGEDEDIETLVEMRQQVGKLRRALAAHRSALTALTHPELEALGNVRRAFPVPLAAIRIHRPGGPRRTRVHRRFLRGAHRSHGPPNESHHEGAHAHVRDPPSGALIAGVMGMNFKVGLFEDSWMFYVVLAVILALAPLTVVVAKMRDWI